MKLELWHNVLTEFSKPNPPRPLFTDLVSYRLKQRDEGLSRYVCSCTGMHLSTIYNTSNRTIHNDIFLLVPSKNLRANEYFSSGDLAVVSTSKTSFFAHIFEVQSSKFVEEDVDQNQIVEWQTIYYNQYHSHPRFQTNPPCPSASKSKWPLAS